MGFLIGFIVLIIILVVAYKYENKPEVKKARDDAFLRSCGIDPDSEKGRRINAQANMMELNAQMRDIQQRHETAQIITSAAIGSAIAGDAGAVIGAVTAKNKIDSQK